ncbi:PepSY-associated TM helix domain-containing protein [Limnobacter sp.]|uniref:PepSY-associated TM helix domain-containing protein n=1 Tax=Limnobacter sp. TaxID=2003368 RepID=UPI002FE0E6FD
MTPSIRQHMAWFHTWFGLVIGFLLFSVFWTGTLTVFDKEFDRWMHPESRSVQSPCCSLTPAQLETVLLKVHALAPESANLRVRLPTARTPMPSVRITEPNNNLTTYHIDPDTGKAVPGEHTLGGTGFFFPFHYKFNIAWMNVGYYMLGIAGLAMLTLLVSGAVLHRKLLAEFFLFRPKKHKVRSLLDLHNLSSVVALPFYIVMTFSGLLILFSIYFQWATLTAFDGNKAASQKAMSGFINLPPSGFVENKSQQLAALKSIPALVQAREAAWSAALGEPATADAINIRNLGDSNALLEIRRVFPERSIGMSTHADTLLLHTGELLHAHEPKPVKSFTHWINGLHFIQFDHAALRVLYVIGGLLGCVMIHTGFLFWLESRKVRHHKRKLPGFTVVQALAVGGTLGMMIATAAFLVANQLIPHHVANRATLETNVFYGVWVLVIAWAFINAVTHKNSQWLAPTWLFTTLCALAWLLNQINTGGMLTALHLQEMNSFAIDVGLLIMAASGVYAARKLTAPERVAGLHKEAFECN